MSTASLIPTIKTLEKYFDKLNERFFESALSKPIITLHEGVNKKAFGWVTVKPVWQDNKTKTEYIELNISCDYLNRDIVNILGTLHHEMVHIYNMQNNIQDVSRSSQYHNRNFKTACEQHGLSAEKNPKYGYMHKIPDTTKDYYNSIIQKTDVTQYSRKKHDKDSTSKTSSTRKYICPQCQQTIRATKEVNIICGNCNKKMIEQ